MSGIENVRVGDLSVWELGEKVSFQTAGNRTNYHILSGFTVEETEDGYVKYRLMFSAGLTFVFDSEDLVKIWRPKS